MISTLTKKLTFPTLLLAVHLNIIAAASPIISVDQADQEIAIDEQDRIESDSRFHPSERVKLDHIKGRQADGVKAYLIDPHLEGGFIPPDDRSAGLQIKACRLQLFGIYELEKEKSFAGKNDIGIFTKFRFKLIEDWRGGAANGHKHVHLVMQGGEIEYKGEKLRAENTIAHYVVGKRYLLQAGTRENNKSDGVVYSYSPFIEVVKGLLYPGPDVNVFTSGTSLSSARAEVADALKKRSCE
jgi:hypothetical protein